MASETPQQVKTAKTLRQLQLRIQTSEDQAEILAAANEAVATSRPIPPCISERLHNGSHQIRNKEKNIQDIIRQSKYLENPKDSQLLLWRDQIAANIAQLILAFVEDGTVDRGLKIVDDEN